METTKFNPKSFLNVKELSTQEDLLVKGGGKDKKKDGKKHKQNNQTKSTIDFIDYSLLISDSENQIPIEEFKDVN